MPTLWKCGSCNTFNGRSRTVCRSCQNTPPTESEREAMATVVLPVILAERTHLKSQLDEAVLEEKVASARLEELEQMAETDLARHRQMHGCDCPLPCPVCGKTSHWDMAMEGHYCGGCGWYDGVK